MYKQFVALSGFAMILILLNHSSTFVTTIPQMLGDPVSVEWQQSVLAVFQVLGIIAVPVYFVVSGSFLAYAYQGMAKERSKFFKFIGSSVERILWPYLIWSTLFYLMIYFLFNIRLNWFDYGKDLLVGYPYNFVPLLVFYYLVSPVVIWVGRRYPHLLLGVIFLYQLTLLNLLSPGILGFIFPEWVSRFRPPIIARTMADWAIFFPIGIVYGLEKAKVIPWAIKYKRVFIVIFFVAMMLSILDKIAIIRFPQASHFAPLAFICLLPAIDRNSIPLVRRLEQIGKRSYGFYLTQIIILDLILFLVHILKPEMFTYPILLTILCFPVALFVPWGLMIQMAKPPTNRVYAYLFG